MKISADDVEAFAQGQPISLTAIVREYDLRGRRLLLKQESKKVK